jgi:hypothetical protein
VDSVVISKKNVAIRGGRLQITIDSGEQHVSSAGFPTPTSLASAARISFYPHGHRAAEICMRRFFVNPEMTSFEIRSCCAVSEESKSLLHKGPARRGL